MALVVDSGSPVVVETVIGSGRVPSMAHTLVTKQCLSPHLAVRFAQREKKPHLHCAEKTHARN